METNTVIETEVKMYKRDADLNKELDGVEKADPGQALDEQAGIGIGFLLGMVRFSIFISVFFNSRNCILGCLVLLHPGHVLQAVQDPPWNIRGGGACLPEI